MFNNVSSTGEASQGVEIEKGKQCNKDAQVERKNI